MAIKYISIPDKKKVVAILEGTRWDALNKIAKLCGNSSVVVLNKKYEMPDKLRAVACCAQGDEWNEEVGKNIAKEKLMRKYYYLFDNRIDQFRKEVKYLNAMLQQH